MRLLGKIAVLAIGGAMAFSAPAMAQDDTVTIGVSIPAATHGWAGASTGTPPEAQSRLQAQYDNIEIVLVTADGPAQQANDLEDLVSITISTHWSSLPFESRPLTDPVRRVRIGRFRYRG